MHRGPSLTNVNILIGCSIKISNGKDDLILNSEFTFDEVESDVI